MPEQFRRVRTGKRSQTFRLAEQVRAAKVESERDDAVIDLIQSVQDAVLRIAMTGIGGDAQLAQIRVRATADENYRPPIDVCARIVMAAALYADVNDLDSGTLRDRLIAIERDDLPDSLQDPDTI
jgi:hypothetical protein